MKPVLFILPILVLVCTVASAEAQFSSSPAHDQTIPPGAKVNLVFEHQEYFVGEDVSFQFVLENTGDAPFEYETGGDYRGASRALRFKITATDPDGHECEDPDPNPQCFGGLVGWKTLGPGQKYATPLWLPTYRTIEKPGQYTIRGWHDFGWKEGERKYPVGEATILFKEPKAEDAEHVVAAVDQLPEDRRTYYALRHPSYTVPLVKRAKEGNLKVLQGLGSIPTPEATAALIELASDQNQELALAAGLTLNGRLPDPEFAGQLPGRGPFRSDQPDIRQRLAKRAWEDRFTPQVRKLGAKFVAGKETREIGTGAFMLQAVGTKEDAPAVLAAMDRTLNPAVTPRKDPNDNILNLPEPLGELARTIQVLSKRGFALSKGANGEALLSGDAQFFTYFYLLENTPGPRPQDWLRILTVFGENGKFPTREAAVRSIPTPVPEECRAFIGDRLADPDLGVCRAACEIAEKSGAREFLPALIEIVATENHEWLLRSASNAASALGGGLALHREWVERLAEEKLYGLALDDLQTLIEGLPGSSSGRTDLTRTERIALRTEWRRFLQAHGDEIAKGKRFSLEDPALTPSLFGRAREWQLANGKTWPATQEAK